MGINWPKLKRDCVGRSVRIARRIETRSGKIFDKGAIMKIVGSWRGRFVLEAVEICGLCKMGDAHRIGGVSVLDLELLP